MTIPLALLASIVLKEFASSVPDKDTEDDLLVTHRSGSTINFFNQNFYTYYRALIGRLTNSHEVRGLVIRSFEN